MTKEGGLRALLPSPDQHLPGRDVNDVGRSIGTRNGMRTGHDERRNSHGELVGV